MLLGMEVIALTRKLHAHQPGSIAYAHRAMRTLLQRVPSMWHTARDAQWMIHQPSASQINGVYKHELPLMQVVCNQTPQVAVLHAR